MRLAKGRLLAGVETQVGGSERAVGGSGLRAEDLEFPLCHFPSVWPWRSGFSSLSLSFLICKMEMIIVPTSEVVERNIQNDGYKMLSVVPGVQ